MATEHFQVHAGMEVLGADQQRIGTVAEVRAADFVIERSQEHTITVPFGAIGSATETQVVLTISADHVDAIKWPQEAETGDQPAPVGGSDDPIVL